MADRLAEKIVVSEKDGILVVDNDEVEGFEVECDTRHLTIRATFKDGSVGPRWIEHAKWNSDKEEVTDNG